MNLFNMDSSFNKILLQRCTIFHKSTGSIILYGQTLKLVISHQFHLGIA